MPSGAASLSLHVYGNGHDPATVPRMDVVASLGRVRIFSQMRYIDTGTRDPVQALGSWLARNVQRDPSLIELRWQTGFFGADSLGYFAPSMARLRAFDGVVHVLVGSNDGHTQQAAVEALLAV